MKLFLILILSVFLSAISQETEIENNANKLNSSQVLTNEDLNNIPKLSIPELASTQVGVVRREGSQSIQIRGLAPSYYLDGFKLDNFSIRLSKQMLDQIVITNNNSSNLSGSSSIQLETQTGSDAYNFDLQLVSDGSTRSPGGNFRLANEMRDNSFFNGAGNGFKNMIASASGPIIPNNPNHTFFIAYDQIWTNDDRPSFVATNKKSELETFTIAANINSEITPQLNARFAYYRSEANGNPYIHNRAYFGEGLGHTMRYEDQSSFFNGTITYQLNRDMKVSVKAGMSEFEHVEGDNRYFDDFGKYGDLELNRYKGDQSILEQARKYGQIGNYGATAQDAGTLTDPANPGSGFTDIFGDEAYRLRRVFAVNDVWNSYGKSGGEDVQFEVKFDYLFRKHSISAGFGLKSSTLRRWYIYPTGLTDSNTGELGTDFASYFRTTDVRNIGYDIFGKQVDANGKDYLNGGTFTVPNENAAESPANPKQSWVYVQDQFSFHELHFQFGARIDNYDPNWINLIDPLDPVKNGPDPNTFDLGDTKPSETFTEFQPRLELTFQESEDMQLGFSFSRSARTPNWNYIYSSLYEFFTDFQGAGNTILNPNLRPEKVNAIEFGLAYQIDQESTIKLRYFTHSLIDFVQFQRVNIPVSSSAATQIDHYYTFANLGSASSNGLELNYFLQLEQRTIINLNYLFSSSVFSSNTVQDSDTPHYLSVLFNHKLMREIETEFEKEAVIDMNFSLLLNYQSGRPYTERKVINSFKDIDTRFAEIGATVNGKRGPSIITMDLKIEKRIELLTNTSLHLFLDIENLLNTETILSVHRATGLSDDDGYLDTAISDVDNETDNPYKREAYIYLLNNPANWGKPRTVRFGVNVEL